MKIKAIKARNFRDGTGRGSRALRSLDPDYVAADERTLVDWIRFVQAFAEELKFFNARNEPEGDWTPFFAGDADAIAIAMDALDETATLDPQRQAILAKPQLALFLTFLKLLQYPQQQFRALTQRRLDFYYRRVLQLAEKGPTPDRARVLFSLAPHVSEHVLKKGTLLSAGNDGRGKPLQYALDRELYLTRARVASVKTLSVEKVYVDLKTIHLAGDRTDEGFENMLRWAIGTPGRGDELPAFPTADLLWVEQGTFAAIADLHQEIADDPLDRVTEPRQQYILYELGFVSLEDFNFCFDAHAREMAKQRGEPESASPTELEWQQVYARVEKAYRKKIHLARRDRLKQVHQSEPDAEVAFLKLWEYALGDPMAGDRLPPFQDRPVDLDVLLGLLDNAAEDTAEDAERYVRERLSLSASDFRKIMDIRARFAADTSARQWQEAYRLLERAQSRKRNFVYPPIGRTEVRAIRSRSVADAAPGTPIALPRFHPFTGDAIGGIRGFGVAIASPVLQMQEGTREIVATLVCRAGTLDRDLFDELLERGDRPFAVAIASETGWLDIDRQRLQVEIVDEIVAIAPEARADGDAATEILLPSLQFTFTLDATQPAIAKLPPEENAADFATPYPVLKIALDTKDADDYKLFEPLCLEKVRIRATVRGFQTLQLRGDRATIDPKSPFEPFDTQPIAGNSFYFTHAEITAKKLDELTLNLEWMGLPESFRTHYYAYSRCGLFPAPPAIENDSFQARLDLLLDRAWHPIGTRSLFSSLPADSPTSEGTAEPEVESEDMPDSATGEPLASQAALHFTAADFSSLPAIAFSTVPEEPATRDLRNYSRYFRLELTPPDFQHAIYSLVLNKVASAADEDVVPGTEEKVRSLTVYPPYTPKLKRIRLDYRATAEIRLSAPTNAPAETGSVFQLRPFGYLDLRQTVAPEDPDPCYFFLPPYDLEGSLFVGLRDQQPGRSLTLLFQMVSGSGDADRAAPSVEWSYLAGDRWQPFQPADILSDSTNGLLDSGILHLTLPEDATQDNHLLPAGLHWLRAVVKEGAAAIPDAIALRAQAAIATFVDRDNDPEHLSAPLAARSINALVERDAAIAAVEQPYSSFGGRRAEIDRAFYTRVSERLRHKQRAIARWDYERLVLERFPQIYKVKCLTQAEQNNDPSDACVTLVVVPNLANTAPFLPLEPKAPQYLLRDIEAYVRAHTSPFVRVVAKNPTYEQIQYRVAVRFRTGQEQGYYLKQLNEELVRFLSPWAYEEQSDISFGSSIHGSAVVHFLETRPYVDYIANLKLIEQAVLSTDRQPTLSKTVRISSTNLARVTQADSILVSAPEHIIDFITTADYAEEEFEGIGYAIVGLDFVVT